MGIDLSKSENVLSAIREADGKAAKAWSAAEKMKADMIAEGVNLLTDTANLEKLETAYRVHDEAAQEREDLRDRLGRIAALDSAKGSRAEMPTYGGGGGASNAGSASLFRFGARFTEHPSFKQASELAAKVGDAGFSNSLKDFAGEGISLMSRAEAQMMIAPGRFGATVISGGGATSAGPFIQNDLQSGFVSYNRKTPRLAAIVGQGETDSDVVEYVTQSAPTNNAAEAGETNNAAESAYPFATATTNVQEIVHYVPITRRAMQDAGQMRSIVEGELVADVFDRLDTQIASGGGTGDDLQGIYTAVTQTQDAAGLSKPAALQKAMTKIRIAAGVLLEPDYIGIHPTDYEKYILDEDGQGRFLAGDPANMGPRTAWGVPFVVSTVFTSGTPLVGNFERGARLWMRSGVELLSGLNDNDFIQRRISLMATMRAAFKTIRPTAFTEVTNF